MAIIMDGYEGKLYEGKVLRTWERNEAWDSDFYAEVWDEEEQRLRDVMFYTTRYPCYGEAKADATEDVLRKVYRLKKREAAETFERYNRDQAREIRKGDTVRIVKGRKVKKGSVVKVFWAGRTYNPYAYRHEDRIGVEVGEDRVFINAENAEVVDWEKRLIHGKERKKIIREWALEGMPYRFRNNFVKKHVFT